MSLLGARKFIFYRPSNLYPAINDIPYPAPAGYHWEYVKNNGEVVKDNGKRVVYLVEN